MAPGDAARDRQPEPRGAVTRRKQGAKDERSVLGRDSPSGVGDLDSSIRRPVLVDTPDIHPDLSRGADRLERVSDQLDERSFDLTFVDLEVDRSARVLEMYDDLGDECSVAVTQRCCRRPNRPSHGRRKLGIGRHELLRLRDFQERADRRVDASDLSPDPLERLAIEVARGAVVEEDVDRALDSRKRVLDLVRESCGELADQRHLFIVGRHIIHPDLGPSWNRGVQAAFRAPEIGGITVVSRHKIPNMARHLDA